MAEKNLNEFKLPQTKGSFQVSGLIVGCEKDDFYKEGKTSKGKPRRDVKFGITYDGNGIDNSQNKNLYLKLTGYTKNTVYFSKRVKKGEKPVGEKVNWAERTLFNKEGYSLMGTHLGLRKVPDNNNKLVNDKVTLVEYDACKRISELMEDDMAVFIKGSLDFSSFTNQEGELVRMTNLTPNQISLTSKPIDFTNENFEPTHDFTQVIVFEEISQETIDGKKTGRGIVTAKIVTYSSIETTQFIIENQGLCKKFKTLKPYTAIEVWGKINAVSPNDEVVEDDDTWGESNNMTRQSGSYKRELVITGAKQSSIDTNTYSEEKMSKAIKAIKDAQNAKKDFGENLNQSDDWGSPTQQVVSIDDEEDAW